MSFSILIESHITQNTAKHQREVRKAKERPTRRKKNLAKQSAAWMLTTNTKASVFPGCIATLGDRSYIHSNQLYLNVRAYKQQTNDRPNCPKNKTRNSTSKPAVIHSSNANTRWASVTSFLVVPLRLHRARPRYSPRSSANVTCSDGVHLGCW